MDAMVERIERLERSVRRFRWAGGAFACLAVVGLVMGQVKSPQPRKLKTVEAERFVLRDADGVIRGRWEITEALFEHLPIKTLKMTSLWMGTKVGKNNEYVGPKVLIYASEDSAHISLGLGNPDREWTDPRSRGEGTSWAYNADHSAEFKIRSTYGFTKDDEVYWRDQGTWIASAEGPSRISIIDKRGQDRAILGASSTVTKSSGVTHQRPESSLVLFDEKGKVLHQVP